VKVLVVDDHAAFREEVLAILKNNGHEAHGAGGAREAIELAEAGCFDCIFVDFSMPEHSGLWFLEHVHFPRPTPVILVTAHVSEQLVQRMRIAGALGHLIKPFTENQLLRRLEEARDARENAGGAP
jgi:CheY-like chemotaxis protein